MLRLLILVEPERDPVSLDHKSSILCGLLEVVLHGYQWLPEGSQEQTSLSFAKLRKKFDRMILLLPTTFRKFRATTDSYRRFLEPSLKSHPSWPLASRSNAAVHSVSSYRCLAFLKSQDEQVCEFQDHANMW